jgi:hypothetical protein
MQDKSLDTRELFNEEMPQCDLSMVSHERNINCCYPADVDAPNPFQQFQICMVGIGCANSDLAKSVAIQKLAYGCDNGKTSCAVYFCFYPNLMVSPSSSPMPQNYRLDILLAHRGSSRSQ